MQLTLSDSTTSANIIPLSAHDTKLKTAGHQTILVHANLTSLT